MLLKKKGGGTSKESKREISFCIFSAFDVGVELNEAILTITTTPLLRPMTTTTL